MVRHIFYIGETENDNNITNVREIIGVLRY